MFTALIGTKKTQTQAFDQNGHRMPVTVISAGPCWITQIKTEDSDGYTAVQLGFGTKRENNLTKPLKGHIKKAGLTKQAPRFFREISVDNVLVSDKKVKLGDTVTVDQVFYPGDIVSVTGTSKGKGFAGVMKRWHFAGGPATHGQSDRARAPGSIGASATPGRVYKGKKMPGRMGGESITVKNLKVVSIDKDNDELVVSGLIPGPKKSLVQINITKKTDRPTKEKEVEAKKE